MHLVGVLLTATARVSADAWPTAGAALSALDSVTSARDGVEHAHVHVTDRGIRLTLYLAGCDRVDAVSRAVTIAHRVVDAPLVLSGFAVADFKVLDRPSAGPRPASP
ncbi:MULTISPECIES: hypothetical protein [Streptomyces]|uniref:hypothetical protein n=1 Tax=Streptomyces TaxID=1883 RepID=UPI0004ABB4C7|nr:MULTISPECIES: hypothetical protein [Streptomyces]